MTSMILLTPAEHALATSVSRGLVVMLEPVEQWYFRTDNWRRCHIPAMGLLEKGVVRRVADYAGRSVLTLRVSS